MNQNNQPLYQVKEGGISVSLWNGQYGYSLQLQKGKFNKQTQSMEYPDNLKMYLNVNDLSKVIGILTQMKSWIYDHPEPKQNQQGFRQNQRFQPPPAQHPYGQPPITTNPPYSQNPQFQGGHQTNGGQPQFGG